jgi:predicted dehydrogenase
VVQDVVTNPPCKWARLQGVEGYVEWHCGFEPGCDAVIVQQDGAAAERRRTEKTRPDDFIRELRHIEDVLARDIDSPISLERGLDTMLVIAAAHESARTGQTVQIDPAAGYTLSALTTAHR